MSDTASGKSARRMHWSFWIIGIFALLWNVMGCVNFFMQTSPEMLAQMPEPHRAIAEMRPAWASASFAVSVFGGVLASVFLLLRRSAAFYLFVTSLIGVVATMLHAIAMGGALSTFGTSDLILTIVMPILVAVFLAAYSKRLLGTGWIK